MFSCGKNKSNVKLGASATFSLHVVVINVVPASSFGTKNLTINTLGLDLSFKCQFRSIKYLYFLTS